MSQAGIINVGDSILPPDVPTQFTTDDGIATPSLHNINVFGGVGVSTTGSGSTITVTVKNEGFQWSEQAVSFNASVEEGYFCTAGLTVNLPSSLSLVIGNTLIVYVDTSSTVTIQAASGEFIQVGINISNVSGSASSNTRGSILTLVYRPTDTTWHAISSFGSWTVSGP